MASAREWVVQDYAQGYKSLTLRHCDVETPGPGEVRLRVEAFALNWGDMDLMRGVYSFTFESLPARIGIEAAGIVDAVGPDVQGIETGERYCTLPYFYYDRGASADSVIVDASFVTRAPEGLSAVESASIWMALLTAYYPIAYLNDARPGLNMLVTAGTSTAGNAALTIGSMCGATMIATTRFDTNTDYLRESGATHVYASSSGEPINEFLDRVTGGTGVHVVFDCVAGNLMSDYAKSMARDARIYYYGLLDGAFPDVLPIAEMFQANASFHPYSVFNYVEDAEACARGTKFVYDGFASGKLRASVDRVFPMEQYIEAWDYMRTTRSSHGKIVVETGLT